MKEISLQNLLVEDLGFDSLKLFELVNDLEVSTGISIASQMDKVKTVEDLLLSLQSANNQKSETADMNKFPAMRSKSLDKKLTRWIEIQKKCYNFKVLGEENIPNNQNYILCSNHASYFDPLWILAAMGEEKFAKDKLACLAAVHTKKHKEFFNMLGGIPVDRQGNTLPAIKRLRECLKLGFTVIIFPEGRRSVDGRMFPFKNGAAELSLDTGVPILPVRMDGTFEIFPRHHRLPRIWDWKNRKKYTLCIRFGEIINPQDYEANELTEKLESVITEMEKSK